MIEAEEFAVYPQALRNADASNSWIASQPVGLSVDCFLEGPVFDRDGNLFCVDIPNGRILKIDAAGCFSVAIEYDGWPNGLKFHRDGRLFIADYKNGIMVADLATGQVAPVVTRNGTEPFKGVNDLAFASNGDLYFTDQGMSGLHDPAGAVYVLPESGALRPVLKNVPSPNGLVLSKDETTLFLAVTRANAIWRVPLLPNGGTTKVGNYIQLSGGVGPDGIALTRQGGLAVAHAGKGVVWIFDETGEPVLRINTPGGPLPTNIAFGGADGRTLFIVESHSGRILRARVPVEGQPLFATM